MRDNNVMVSVISVNAQGRQEQAETSATVIYSSYRQVCDIKNFLKTHYLTTRTYFLIPYNGAQCLSWYRGKRSMTFYLAKETPQLMLNFRNCFNCLETAYIYAATTLKTDIDRSEATCNNQTTFYDQQTTHAHEVNITTLSLEHALWLNQLLESHKVTDRKGNAILISDITSEISDETNATNKLKFTWRFSDNSLSLETPHPDKIFTEQYNPQFS